MHLQDCQARKEQQWNNQMIANRGSNITSWFSVKGDPMGNPSREELDQVSGQLAIGCLTLSLESAVHELDEPSESVWFHTWW